MTHARRLLAALLVLSFILTIPGHLAPVTDIDGLGESSLEKTRDEVFTVSEQELTTWYHDGSNTTGWVQAVGSWTINSTGTELYCPMTSSSAGIVHAVFYYDLETSIVVGNDMKLEAQFNYTTGPMKQGGINLMAQ